MAANGDIMPAMPSDFDDKYEVIKEPKFTEPPGKAKLNSQTAKDLENQAPETGVNVGDEEEDTDNWDEEYDKIDQDTKKNPIAYGVKLLQKSIISMYQSLMIATKGYLIPVILLKIYAVYFIAAMIYEFGDEASIRLLVCTIIGVLFICRNLILFGLKKLYYPIVGEDGMSTRTEKIFNISRLVLRWTMYGAMIAFMIWVLVDRGQDNLNNLTGVVGLFCMTFICLLFSTKPHKINWHTIFWSIGLQFLFAYCVVEQSFGRDAMEWIKDRIDEFFSAAEPAFVLLFGPGYQGMGLAISSVPLAFLTGGTLTLMYYIGALSRIIYILGSLMSFIMDVAFVESLAVAGGIFIDGPLAVLSLRSYLMSQSRSQLFTIVTSTYSSLGATFMAVLAAYQVDLTHIIPAMLISAPATFTVCKLMVPESRPRDDKNKHADMVEQKETHANFLDAFQSGAILALPLVGNVIALVFALMSGIEWLNVTLEWFGDRVGKEGFTLEYILSYLLYPVAMAMGIRSDERRMAGRLLGIRAISTSLLSFFELRQLVVQRDYYENYMNQTNNMGPVMHDGDDLILGFGNNTFLLEGGIISRRTEAILTYSLCGLSGFISMGLVLGAFFAFLPKRREWLVRMALPALIAGNIANFMTGCFAGLFYEEELAIQITGINNQ